MASLLGKATGDLGDQVSESVKYQVSDLTGWSLSFQAGILSAQQWQQIF